MNKIFNKIIFASLHLCIFASLMISCSDYLNEQPKGKNIPDDLEDFSEMLNYEYYVHRCPASQALYLMGDQFCQSYYLTGSYPLYQANYNWDTSINRAEWNNSDEDVYYVNYSTIGYANLIMENSQGTDSESKTVHAYAQALRGMAYWQLTNYYANAYSEANKTQLAVPFITSSAVNAPYTQVTLEEIYTNIIADIEAALPSLPDKGRNILLPGKSTCYAFLARVYLSMMNYTKAEEYADKALAMNSDLYDWVAFYETNKSKIEEEGKYNKSTSPMDFTYCENYDYKHGSSSYSGSIMKLPVWRAERFEDGDAKFKSSWKYRDYGSYTCYDPMLSGYFNYAGCKTVEQYLIKAECEARSGNIDKAMDLLNTVRKTRIMKDMYQPLTASTTATAISLICRTKWNDLIGSLIPFSDIRRLNAEGKYPFTLTYTRDGKQVSLAPDSYLWTMPFPKGAVDNPGGGHIEYIATK